MRASAELPRLAPHPTRCGSPRTAFGSRRGILRASVLALVHLAAVAHVAHWRVSGRTLSPLEPSEGALVLELGYVNAGLIVLVLSVASTLVVGRFFCGWACHVVAVQDLAAWMLAKLRLRPRPLRSRFLAWVPALVALEMFVLPTAFRLARGGDLPAPRAAFTTADLWERFPGPGVALLTLAVDGALLVWLFGAKGFCAYGCPYGALFGAADRFARGRIRVSDACEGCGHCTAVCTSNVRVHEEVARFGQVVDRGCMKCLDCVRSCPKGALSFGFGASRAAALGGRPARPTDSDFGWGEELSLALVFVAALFALRGAYDLVPLLLAVGLALALALAAPLAWRLVRRPELALQALVLKRGGRWTAAGATAGVLAAAAFAAAGHCAIWTLRERASEAACRAAGQVPTSEPERRRVAFETAAASLERQAQGALFDTAVQEERRGLVARELGDLGAAEAHLREALAIEPGRAGSRVALADLLLLRGEREAALAELYRVLDEDPDHEPALERLRRSGARP
jgi:polyferredoxin